MLADINSNIGYELILALGAFLLSMFLTPIYTTFAYKHKLWKRQKSVDVTGAELTVMNKLHKDKIKRHFPTMAGMIMLVTVPVVLIACNCLNRGQTWLPIAAFVGGGLIGFIDDVINLFGKNAAAGLRAPVKFAMITALGAALGWFFAVKLGWTSVTVPFMGAINIGVVGMIILFAFAVVATGNAVNISDGLDGLAGGLAMLAYGSYGVIALSGALYDGGYWFVCAWCGIRSGRNDD